MDPIALNQEATSADVGGALFSALTSLQAGNQARKAANFQAEQLRQQAGQQQASAQRQAADVARQGDMIASSALAHAAASGGGASDPTVINLIARNAGESAYRQAVALYGGDEAARTMQLQADAREYEGKQAQVNGAVNAAAQTMGARATLLKGMAREASLYQRFGAGGPKTEASN
jgi:hypothetical protein